jgi:hypothetical protein
LPAIFDPHQLGQILLTGGAKCALLFMLLGSDTHAAKDNMPIAMMTNLAILTKFIGDPLLRAAKRSGFR